MWLEIHAEYHAKIDNDELLPSDRCSLAYMKVKFGRERKVFQEHVAKQRRMMQSGAPAEAVRECTDYVTCTTEIFRDSIMTTGRALNQSTS